MPYDIVIKAKNAETIDAEYTVMPKPKRENVTPEELAQIKTLKPIDEVVSKLLANQAGGEMENALAA
jgi:hypothetical protein